MSLLLLPETAPFSPSQRAWLNGFLAGMLGMLLIGTPVGVHSGKDVLRKKMWHAILIPLDTDTGPSLHQYGTSPLYFYLQYLPNQ